MPFSWSVDCIFDGCDHWALLKIEESDGVLFHRIRMNDSTNWKIRAFQTFLRYGFEQNRFLDAAVAGIVFVLRHEFGIREWKVTASANGVCIKPSASKPECLPLPLHQFLADSETCFAGVVAAIKAFTIVGKIVEKAKQDEARGKAWKLCRALIAKGSFGLAYRLDESVNKLHLISLPLMGKCEVDFTPTATTLAEAADQIVKASLRGVANPFLQRALAQRSLDLMLEARLIARNTQTGAVTFGEPRWEIHHEDSDRVLIIRKFNGQITASHKFSDVFRYSTISCIGYMIDTFLDKYSGKAACEASNSSKPS